LQKAQNDKHANLIQSGYVDFNFIKDFPSYLHAHIFYFFSGLSQAQANTAFNDLISKGELWAPFVKDTFRIPLNPNEEADRAYLLANELANTTLLKLNISELSNIERRDTINTAWEKYWRANDFNSPKNLEKREAFLNKTQEVADHYGRQIPYHQCFPAWWVETVQSTPNYALEALLEREMTRLNALFTNDWEVSISKKDIQYLSSILTEATENKEAVTIQRLNTAVAWLNAYGQEIFTVESPPYNSIKPISLIAAPITTPAAISLFDKLCGGFKPEQLMRVVGQEGLGLYDTSINGPTDTATSTNWAFLYWGLQYKGFLPAGLSAGKASELLKNTFGAAVSKTRINDTKPDLGEKLKGYLAHVVKLLDTL
jgi:hypothetical protein